MEFIKEGINKKNLIEREKKHTQALLKCIDKGRNYHVNCNVKVKT